MVDAVADGLAEGGLYAGNRGEVMAQGLEQLRLASPGQTQAPRRVHVQRQVDLARLDTLNVLIFLGPPGPAPDGNDLGVLHQRLLHQSCERIALVK